jgi:glycosyltransferase involved in cell wall biosynthesis
MVIFFEGDSPTVGGTKSGLRRFYRILITKCADAFITNSQSGKAYLVRQLSASRDKIYAKPCEVPDPSISLNVKPHEQLPHWPSEERPVFLFVGQLIKRKGISYLLDACRVLRDKGCSRWTLAIIGDGQNRAELEGYTHSLGLARSVHWIGWVNNEDLGSYLQSCDVFVFPTLEDTWGVAVLEAMMFEKPILCSKEAGAVEMIEEGGNGFIFDPSRPQILADLMKKFIDDPTLIDSMGKRSGQRIKPFTPEATARHFAKIIDAVSSNRHERVPRPLCL